MEANTHLEDRTRTGLPDGRFGAVRAAVRPRPATEPSPAWRSSPSGFQDLIDAVDFREMEVEFDPSDRVLWCRFACSGRPSFTPALVRDIHAAQDAIRQGFLARREGEPEPVRYMVWASRMPGVWSLGGDLDLFAGLIRSGDRDGLLRYALKVVEIVYRNCVALDLPIITAALVQGDALGGGFEGVLSSNLIVAEKSAKFGLPEVLFNLFPGMGAYSLLARRISPALAERMILSGRIYGAEELYEMGVVDVLAEDGRGEDRLRAYIAANVAGHATHRAIYQARHRINPITHQELIDITTLWVDTAMGLQEADLRKMARLVAAQDRRCARVTRES